MNFRVIESTKVDQYDEMKKDYENGLCGKPFRKKYDIGVTAYCNLLKNFRNDGVKINKRGKVSYYNRNMPKYIYPNKKGKYTIQRHIPKKGSTYYGTYDTLDDAKKKIKELEANEWSKL